MSKVEVITLTPDQLQKSIVEALRQYDEEKQARQELTGTYSINQAAKVLRVAHATLKKLIENGQIKSTSDNRRIPIQALNNYLQNDIKNLCLVEQRP